VPTSVVITRNDRIVPARRQWKLAHALPDCTVIEIDGDHGVFLHAPGRFATAVLAACNAATLAAMDQVVDEPTGTAS
jgi:pimeloyl-ACP methyl ester carboxylesterase